MRHARNLVALAALLGATVAFAQCAKDVDCAGDRVCETGRCVAPARRVTVIEPGASLDVVPEAQREQAWLTSYRKLTVGTNVAGTVTSLVNQALSLGLAVQLAVHRFVELMVGTSWARSLVAAPAGVVVPSSYGLLGGARCFVLGAAPIGPWVGARLTMSLTPLGAQTLFTPGLGAEVGWSLELFKHLALIPGAGVQVNQTQGQVGGTSAASLHVGPYVILTVGARL
jgi:hypothetical protein